MKGEAQRLIKYFDGSDKRFIIPLYQRNYDWKEENCEQLFQDLVKLCNSNRISHFFGSIVSTIEKGSEDRHIIDGQQRITTVSLLLIAMVNAVKEGVMQSEDPKLTEKIFKKYLVDEYQEDERKVKLKPIKKDMQAFDALLFGAKDNYVKGSNVTRNYNFFYDKIQHCGQTLDQLFEAIKKLEVINIKLEEDDDPQLIFESLNSTGLDLSEADKIRNYLLMSLSPAEQDDLYKRFWNPIEENTEYKPTPFVRDYLTMKQGKIGRLDDIYVIFKRYAESKKVSREELMSDMFHYAKIYHEIEQAATEDKRINSKLQELKTLDSTVAFPFYMAFLDYARKNDMMGDSIYEVINLVEAYWARRIICNLPSNALNKIFATLHRDVINVQEKAATNEDSPQPSYYEALVYVLLKKSGAAMFPDDELVRDEFATRQVYKMPAAYRMFILERMENQDNKERHDVVKQLTEKVVTIEHIMPQTLSNAWKAALGDEWERIHQQYLHTMANITLTGYNSQYSNLSFQDKREMEKGFKDSAFRLNNFVKSCEKWTEDELKTRQRELLKVFLKLWPMPTKNFEPVKVEADAAALDDEDVEFTGKKLQAYRYRDVRYSVNTWKEMLIQICGHVLQEKRSTIEWMCANESHGFSQTLEDWRKELDRGIYVWTDNSTATKISILKGMFDECNIPQSELVFEFRPEENEAMQELSRMKQEAINRIGRS